MGLALAAILTVSSIFEAVFLREVSAKFPQELYAIRSVSTAAPGATANSRGLSYPDYEDLRASLPREAWRFVTAWKVQDVTMTSRSGDQPLRIAAISDDYFRIASAHFKHGHPLGSDEMGAVVTSALWHKLSADGDSSQLTVYNQRYEVVGVLDNSFRGLLPYEGIDAWITIESVPRLDGDPGLLSYRELEDLNVLVQSGTVKGSEALGSRVAVISKQLSGFHAEYRNRWHLDVAPGQPPFLDLLNTTEGQTALASLLVMLCVLLAAATNIANLFVIRAVARGDELQLRLALGTPRKNLLAYECLEAVLLGLLGLTLGVTIGTVALHLIASASQLERLRLHLSGVSLGFTCGAAVLFVSVCALVPGLRLYRLREADVLHKGHGITSRGVSWLQRAYLVIQFAFALGFTCVAIQIASAVHQQSAVDVGFDTDKLLVVTGTEGARNGAPAERLSDYNRVSSAISSIRGVIAVSASVSEFFGGYGMTPRPISVVPTPTEYDAHAILAGMDVVAPRYFSTLGLSIRAGRGFGDEDRIGEPPRILVNQTLANLVARDGRPIGTTLYEFGRYPLQIVGVVPDIRATVTDKVRPSYYRCLAQSPLPSFVLYVRVEDPSRAVRLAITSAIVKELPESVGRLQINTAEEQRSRRDLPAIAMFWVSSGLAALVLLIAAIGLYGVASFATLARIREHGIRAALGASPGRLATAVLFDGLRWTLLGAVFGLPSVWVGMKVTTAIVVGVRHAPILTTSTLLGLYVVLVFVSLTLPAHRAASVQPAVALRGL